MFQGYPSEINHESVRQNIPPGHRHVESQVKLPASKRHERRLSVSQNGKENLARRVRHGLNLSVALSNTKSNRSSSRRCSRGPNLLSLKRGRSLSPWSVPAFSDEN